MDLWSETLTVPTGCCTIYRSTFALEALKFGGFDLC